MRAGLPCVVHGVGGLQDTVQDEVDGFVFKGDNLATQAAAFVSSTNRALELRRNKPKAWNRIRSVARSRRFQWSDSAQQTISQLYEMSDD